MMFSLSSYFCHFHPVNPFNTSIYNEMFYSSDHCYICRETVHLQFCLRGIKMSNDFLNKPSLKTSRDDSKTDLSADIAAVKQRWDLKTSCGRTERRDFSRGSVPQPAERERERESRNKFNVPIKTGERSEWNWPQVSSKHISSKFNLKFTFSSLSFPCRAQNFSRQHIKYLREQN